MAEPDRLRGLVDAGIALSSELSLDDLLKKLVETAASLTGARYAALGVIDETGTGLERFVHDRYRHRDGGQDRRAPARARHPRGADHGRRVAAVERDRRRSPLGRLPAEPPADAWLSRRADPPARAGLRKPLLDREGRGPVHRRRPRAGRDAGQPGCGGDRERTPVRGRDQLVGAARGAERGRDGAGRRDRATPSAEADLPAVARLDRRAGGDDRLAHPAGTLRIEAADGETQTTSSACSSSGRDRRAASCSSAGGPSASIRSRTIPKSTRRPRDCSVLARASTSLLSPRTRRSASSASMTRKATTRASATTTCALPRPSPRAPRSRSTFRPAWPATRCAGSSRRKSSSVDAWRASSTTRPVRS